MQYFLSNNSISLSKYTFGCFNGNIIFMMIEILLHNDL